MIALALAAVPAAAPCGAGDASRTALGASSARGTPGLVAPGSLAELTARPQADPRPNIVVVMTDDQDVRSMSVLPNVRRLLAEQGTTFANSLVSHPLCCPSRATYLTGQYPHNHGVVDNHPPDGGYEMLDHTETLPVWLGRAGYATAHVGKYMNGYGAIRRTEIPPGWQEWYTAVDPTTYRMWHYTLNENGTLKTYGKPGEQDPALYQTDVYARKAVDYIHRKAPSAQPFFLSLAPLAPHAEGKAAQVRGGDPRPAPRHRGTYGALALPRPPAYDEKDVDDKPAHIRYLPRIGPAELQKITVDYRARLESLLAVDDAVAQLVAALRQHHELDRTLIIFTSDNGWLHGEHRIPRGKRHPYEESIRVPLVVRGPGVARGAISGTPVSNIDLAPTIVDAARAKAGLTLDGRPLTALESGPRDRDLLIETGPKPTGKPWYAAVWTQRYVYVEHSTGETELYDLATDPRQLTSRHADPEYADLRRDLARRLKTLRRCGGDTCP